jgi:hypothetical protein
LAQIRPVVLGSTLYVISGSTNGGGDTPDAWSTTDGTNWTHISSTLPFSVDSYGAAALAGKLWVLGGWNGSGGTNAIRSSSDGVNWTTVAGPFTPFDVGEAVVMNGQIWLYTDNDEVWVSPDGASWTFKGSTSGIDGDAQLAAHGGALWLIGGDDNTNAHNAVWYSYDGATWTLASNSTALGPRTEHCAVDFNGQLWVMAGMEWNSPVVYTDAWYSPLMGTVTPVPCAPTPTVTPTWTSSPTVTPTATPTWTPTVSQSWTETYSLTPTPTDSPTVTQSWTETFSLTPTPTDSPTITQSWTQTYSLTPTPTWTPTVSQSWTQTFSLTPTPTWTPTVSQSWTQTYSLTPTPTWTPTVSQSWTRTFSLTPSPTSSITQTDTPAPSATASPTASPSRTPSATPSPSGSPTPTATWSPTAQPTSSFTASPTRTPGPVTLSGGYQQGSGTYVFTGTGSPGDTVYVVDETTSTVLASGTVAANGTFDLSGSGTINAGDQLAAHSGSAGGPGSGSVAVQPVPAGTPAPAPGLPLDGGATVVPVGGVAGEPVTVVDPATGHVLGTGTVPPGGSGVVQLGTPLAPGETVQVLVGGQLSGTLTAGATAGPAPQWVSGTVLSEGSVIYAKAAAGEAVQVVDGQGRILGSAIADASGNATIPVVGASPGSPVYLVANGVKTALDLSTMTLGAEHAILNRNLFRPSQGPLTVDFKATWDERVTVKVFNLAGELINEIAVWDVSPGGLYQARWDGKNRDGEDVANGVYFVSVHGSSSHILKKVIVLR